jgi:hypothetical protein
MNSDRKIAKIAGALIIVGMIAGVLSIVSVIEEPDYLTKVSANNNQVLIGAFFQFIMIPASIGFALTLYPMLRKYNEGLALGFVGFRTIAGTFHLIGIILLPLFLILSQEFIKAGAPDSSYFQTLGALLRAGRDLVNHVAMILALSIGGLMFFYVLYQSKLVPRWLSGWGFVGTTSTIVASLLLLFRLIDVVTPIYISLNLPTALQEMVLAVWLIVKGFDASVVASGSVKTDIH